MAENPTSIAHLTPSEREDLARLDEIFDGHDVEDGATEELIHKCRNYLTALASLRAELATERERMISFEDVDAKPWHGATVVTFWNAPNGRYASIDEVKHWPPTQYDADLIGWCYQSDLLIAFSAWQKQKLTP